MILYGLIVFVFIAIIIKYLRLITVFMQNKEFN